MPFAIRNLAGLAYAGHVTLWRYRSAADTRALLLSPNYFSPAGHLLRRGDVVLASAADGPLLLEVQNASAGSATVLDARGGPPPPASFAALLVGQSGLAATLTAGTSAPVGGSAPAAPALPGLALAWDFDFATAPLGALAPHASQAGSETGAQAQVGGGAPGIVTLPNGRKALDFNGTTDWVGISNGLAPWNASADAPFTVVVVTWRDVAAANMGVFSVTKGVNSGASTLNRYDLFYAADVQLWRRANGANQADATLPGAPSLVAPNIYVLRGRAAAEAAASATSRGLHNGGAKVSTPARQISNTPGWSEITLGARMVDPAGTARSSFLNGKIERVIAYAGSATDADMDTLQAALATHYVA
jgi:hypothetical protein